MQLADPDKSRIILIGSARYANPALPDLPSVRNNIADLEAALCDPALGGLTATSCHTFVDLPLHGAAQIARLAADATDVLLIYFAGHGLLTEDGKLLLALTDTDPDYPKYNSLQMDHLREAIIQSPAPRKVLIFDCCYSERALRAVAGLMSDAPNPMMEVRGTYTLSSAPANQSALAPADERHTAFTGKLITLLRNGIPGQDELISMNSVFQWLRRELIIDGLPEPKQFHSGTASSLALVRNLAYFPPAPPAPPPPSTSDQKPPVRDDSGRWLALRRTVLDTSQDLNSRIDALDALAQLAWDNTDAAEELKSFAANGTLPVLIRIRCVYEAGRRYDDAGAISSLDAMIGTTRGKEAWDGLCAFIAALEDDKRWYDAMSAAWQLDTGMVGNPDRAEELWGLLVAMLLVECRLPVTLQLRAARELASLQRPSQARWVLTGLLRQRGLSTTERGLFMTELSRLV